MNSNPIIVLGGGGHARVVIDSLLACKASVLGFVDMDPEKRDIEGIARLGGDEYLLSTYDPDAIVLVNGLGSVGKPGVRLHIYSKFKNLGFRFASVAHPSAIVSPSVTYGEGVQIMAGAIVQPGVALGENTIVNTGAMIDHDCRIGAHVHLAPGVTLSGGVSVGSRTHIGTGASVIQEVKIGSDSIVGAGSVVLKNVDDNTTVVGVPAKAKS